MVLKDTMQTMREHLSKLCHDLEKAAKGNRTAAQRVRTGTIKFAQTAKIFRKESVDAEKGPAKKAKKALRKKR